MTQITIDQAMQVAIGHHLAGRLAEAEAIYREVLSVEPARPDALHRLGALACQTGHPDAAIELIARAIAIAPQVADFHSDLAEAYRKARRIDEAIAAYRRAVALEGDDAGTYCKLGLALQETGRPDEAIAAYQRAIALQDDLAEAHNNLGNVLWSKGQVDEAIAALGRAVQLKPDAPKPCNNLGAVLNEVGRRDEALVVLHRSIELQPDYPSAHYNLGNTLWAAGRLDEARSAFQRTIELTPHFAEAHQNLGGVLCDQGRLDDALAALRTAMALRPDDPKAASNLLYLLHYHPDYDSQAILKEHRRWARQFAEPLSDQIRPHDNDRSPERRLRVGFLSTSFRETAQGQLLQPLFLHHDRAQFEFVAYSDTRRPDAVTEKLKAMVDQWCDTSKLSDLAVSDRIRSDRIDILVDLTLHTLNGRLLVFARRPAPVQVTALEMVTTTGLATMDYRLTDRFLDPPGETDGDYAERSIRLPHCLWCYPPPEEAPPVDDLPALNRSRFTFGSLSYFVKISRPTQELWAKVLRAVPGARMMIHCPSDAQRGQIRQVFEHARVSPSRIEFLPTTARSEYYRRHNEFDVCLDTQPYAGGTTTMDSLWMGVPVITLAGRTAVARGGSSLLSNVGLPELIARTEEQYVSIAVEWARDLDRLQAVRAGLRESMRASPLMDGKGYAAHIESALRQMWKSWCDQ